MQAIALMTLYERQTVVYDGSVVSKSRAGGVPYATTTSSMTHPFFEPMSKRRKGFPSEQQVKRGYRVIHGDKELIEKLGRNDPCPCGSGKRFQALLHEAGPVLTAVTAMTTFRDER